MADSRAEAQRLIDGGDVVVRGIPTPKAATLVDSSTPITASAPERRYVGRGALKLEGALDTFGLDVSGVHALDVGASTGGFTDVLLQRGAAHVVALDVGHGQLHERIRSDPRVTVLERTNVRHVGPDDLGRRFSLIVADLSFISLCTVAESLARLAAPNADLVLLIKPQFEAGPADVGRGGIVKDPAVRADAVTGTVHCLDRHGLGTVALCSSPVAGAEGNREVFAWCRAGTEAVRGLEVPE